MTFAGHPSATVKEARERVLASGQGPVSGALEASALVCGKVRKVGCYDWAPPALVGGFNRELIRRGRASRLVGVRVRRQNGAGKLGATAGNEWG